MSLTLAQHPRYFALQAASMVKSTHVRRAKRNYLRARRCGFGGTTPSASRRVQTRKAVCAFIRCSGRVAKPSTFHSRTRDSQALLHTWFDRELSVAGQVVVKDGTCHLVNTGPILRLPSLAIHLYREDSFTPERQHHMQPVLTVGQPNASIMDVVAGQLGIGRDDISAFNLITADAARGERFGSGEVFIAAGRMDNLTSVFASLRALIAAAKEVGPAHNDVLVMAAFDHEEVGSSSRYGAAGPILADVLSRTGRALGADEEQRQQMYARSFCVSADAAHSVHPNYAEKHDPHHHPIIGCGPVTKVNGNQRYASDATSIARWEDACRRAGVPYQRFVGNNAVPCGSTIGPITATRLGISTVDVGIPMLSMHSVREMVGERDQLWLAQAIEQYWVG